jgi:hypothetical protein
MATKPWNYSELSKLAKQYGGPEELVNKLVESGFEMGKKKMHPYVAGGVIVGGVLVCVGVKIRTHFLKKKANSESEFKSAKSEIINGIKNYDTFNSENHNEPNKNLENIEKE